VNTPIRVRLTLWYVGVLSFILIAFSFGFYSLLSKNMRQRLDDTLLSATQVTALALNHETEEHQGKGPGEENVRLVLNTMHQTSFPRQNITVWDGDRLVAEKPGIAGISATQFPHNQNFKEPLDFFNFRNKDHNYRIAVATIHVPYSGGRYRVFASEHVGATEEQLDYVQNALFLTVPIFILLAAVGGYFLARHSLAPVRGMVKTAEKISSDNLDQRLTVAHPGDELGQMAEAFNRLFARLQTAFRQQRRFMADASHELRTPISVALTATQVSLDNRRLQTEALYETLEVVQSQMLRLRRVVEDMFTLAQADSGAGDLRPSTFYLDEVVTETLRAARVLGDARGVAVRTGELAAGAEFTGDEGLIRQLLLILLDNAVKYTPEGGRVEATLIPRANNWLLTVTDTGCGIPPADQPHVFERFYRVDKARSRRQPGAGSGAGLGLAIAQWIAELHHGRIWIAKSDPSGSVFIVELPGGTPADRIASQNVTFTTR
jgi:two-component system OmpR family sensor kinase